MSEELSGLPESQEGSAAESSNWARPPVDGVEAPSPAKKKRRRGGWLIIALSVLLIAGGITLGVMSYWPHGGGIFGGNASGELKDMDGNVVVPDDPSATSSAYLDAANMVVDDGGAGLVIPSVRLSVPMGSINEVNGVMNPPNFTSAFWIRNRGVSLDQADKGTVYIVAHAARYGRAPGNFLQSDEQVSLKAGDIMNINDRVYTFTSAEIIPQNKINEHTDLWDATIAGRVLIITCLQRNDHKAPTDNLVVIGQLVS